MPDIIATQQLLVWADPYKYTLAHAPRARYGFCAPCYLFMAPVLVGDGPTCGRHPGSRLRLEARQSMRNVQDSLLLAPYKVGSITRLLQARKRARRRWVNVQGHLHGHWQSLLLKPSGFNASQGSGPGQTRLETAGWAAGGMRPQRTLLLNRALCTWGRSLRVSGPHRARCLGHVGPRGLGKLRPL